MVASLPPSHKSLKTCGHVTIASRVWFQSHRAAHRRPCNPVTTRTLLLTEPSCIVAHCHMATIRSGQMSVPLSSWRQQQAQQHRWAPGWAPKTRQGTHSSFQPSSVEMAEPLHPDALRRRREAEERCAWNESAGCANSLHSRVAANPHWTLSACFKEPLLSLDGVCPTPPLLTLPGYLLSDVAGGASEIWSGAQTHICPQWG